MADRAAAGDEKGLFEKATDKLTELKDDVMPAHDADEEIEHEEDGHHRRPFWLRLAVFSLPIVAGVVVRQMMSRRNGKQVARPAKARTKSTARKSSRKKAVIH